MFDFDVGSSYRYVKCCEKHDGGSGSGNWGHGGRPGKRGGSAGGGGAHNRIGTKKTGFKSSKKEKTSANKPGTSSTNEKSTTKSISRQNKATAKNTGRSSPKKKYTQKELESMSMPQLRKLATKIATEYYESGKSGISFGNFKPSQAAAMLANSGKRTGLIKDIRSIQKRIK